MLLTIACLWGGSSGRAEQNLTPETHEVLIHGFRYQPAVMTVHVGDTVQWKNTDIVPHTVTAEDKRFSSGAIAPGATWKFVTKKAGTFPYSCTPHPNMHAKLIVQ
jgi:plastocyanin